MLEATYLVGASFVSMSPLTKIARLRVASLIASCSLEMFSFAIRSSRTFSEVLFSFEAMVVFVAESVTAGMVFEEEGRGVDEKKFLCGDKPEMR